jgi:putative hydrolase of the HAD superfamily
VRVVFFDAAGTLFHLANGVGWHYARVAEKHGGYLSAEALDLRFRIVWRAMQPPMEMDGPRPDDDRSWWLSLIVRVFSDAPSTFNLDGFFADVWSEFTQPGVWSLYPEAMDVLNSLRGKCRLGVVSNFDGRLHRILSILGLTEFFEHVIVSSEVGADKPSPKIFTAACKKFDVASADVLFVGDDPDADWHGAERAGMRVYRLKRPENDLRGIAALLD